MKVSAGIRRYPIKVSAGTRGRPMKVSLGCRVLLKLLKAYKVVISPWLRPACRFTPTCSEYAYEAVERFGAWRGSVKALRRLLSCHPLHRGGWDPVA